MILVAMKLENMEISRFSFELASATRHQDWFVKLEPVFNFLSF